MGGQSRREGYRIVHALPVFRFTAEGWVAGKSIVQRFGDGERAQRDASNDAR
jgi:hypothetical protein